MSSELDLDAIEARANAATPGPWGSDAKPDTSGGVGHTCPEHTWYCVSKAGREGFFFVAHDLTPEDSDFIATSRTDVPQLVAEVRKARAALAAAERERDEAREQRNRAQMDWDDEHDARLKAEAQQQLTDGRKLTERLIAERDEARSERHMAIRAKDAAEASVAVLREALSDAKAGFELELPGQWPARHDAALVSTEQQAAAFVERIRDEALERARQALTDAAKVHEHWRGVEWAAEYLTTLKKGRT